MTKYKWWLALAAIYMGFAGVAALQYGLDSDSASNGQYVLGKDRASNAVELTLGLMDGKAAQEDLLQRINEEEALKALSAGPLKFGVWFKDFISINGIGFMPFNVVVIATLVAMLGVGTRVFSRVHRPPASS